MANRAVELHGFCDPGFAGVRDALGESFAKRGELGASLCVWHRGECVVDLWGGFQDRDRSEAWNEDTMAVVFSSTKGIVALALLMLAERGAFDYDDPIATYWPEFAQGGKGAITIRQLLNHRSGLAALDEDLSLDDIGSNWERVTELLARQTPLWEPGTDQGYHGITYGLYAQELFQRLAGKSLGAFIAEEVSGPLGADFYLGLPADQEPRVSPIHPADRKDVLFTILPKLLFHRGTEGRVYRQVALGKDAAKAFRHPSETGPKGVGNFNSERVHSLELPWGNGIGNARGLAKIYGALAAGGEVDGVRLVEEATLDPLLAPQSWVAMDRVLRKPQGWSQGFIKEKQGMFSPNTQSFGHPGAGGALGWCDPVTQTAIGYVPNRMSTHIRSPRAIALAQAVNRSLA